jgi:hypothetical protein
MTVRLLCAYDKYPANAIVTLDANTEAGLVASKVADTNLTGGVTYVAPQPPLTITASRSLNASDSGAVLRCNSASAITLTIPSGLGTGFNCAIVQLGAGKVTLAAGAGVTLNTASAGQFSTSAQYASIGVLPTAQDEYTVAGSVGA